MTVTDVIAEHGRGGCLVECTLSNLETGEPGLSYITGGHPRRLARRRRQQGGLVVGLPTLKALAAENGVFLKFSGATAAALPTLDVGLFSLAGARIEGIQGILNGTTNYILTRMGEGLGLRGSAEEAQTKGIAEPDPAHDVDGRDTASKILLITNACLDAEYVLKDVQVRGIVGVSVDFVRSARREGRSVKLLATAAPGPTGRTMEPRRPAVSRRRDASARPRQRDREGHHLPHRFHGLGDGDGRQVQPARRRGRPPQGHHQHLSPAVLAFRAR